MGGEVGLESHEGQGARFWFRVQLAWISPTEAGALRTADARPAELLPQAMQGPLGGRVLVVEDNRINQQVIGAMLHKLGVDVLMADNGQMAIDMVMANKGQLTAVLMDVQMPVLDGYQATAQIREWERQHGRPELPIIAVTADAFAEDQARCLVSGMNDFLPKPIQASALAQVLSRWQTGAASAADATPEA